MSHSKQLSEVNILERLKEAWLILREHIQDTLRGSAIGALIAAAGAFIGGLLGGPAGMGIGGVVGAVGTGLVRSFVSLPTAMNNMGAMDRSRLGKIAVSTLTNLLWALVAKLPLLLRCKSWSEVIQLIKEFASEFGDVLVAQVLQILLKHRSNFRFT